MSSRVPASLLGTQRQGLLFVVSAPAGTGKTTLVQMLLRDLPQVKASVSCTTRLPRKGEVEGEHYCFLTEKDFLQKVEGGDFLEHVHLFGHYYGTSKEMLHEQQRRGNHVILTIDTQGALQLKGRVPAVFIFVRPPSIEELHRRLVNRRTESEESVAKRIAWAEKELTLADQYDYLIVNDDLETAYEVLKSIVVAESHRVQG